MRIIWDAEACFGCRTCELVCSFHHQGVFSPELSSVQVSINNRTAKIKRFINSSCDSCKGEPEGPLCVKYCAYGALKKLE